MSLSSEKLGWLATIKDNQVNDLGGRIGEIISVFAVLLQFSSY